jgi:tRNA (mo5U34)-methyltransferase
MTNAAQDRKDLTDSQDLLRRQILGLGKWFHNMDFGGVETAPDHFLGDYPRSKWRHFADAIPSDLRGKTVLDIGCNAGFYSIEMKNRGADRVVAIDSDPMYLDQARFAANRKNADIEFRQMDVYSVADLREKFDLVLFMGVLYHLRHPLLALDLIHDHVVKDQLVAQSLIRGISKIAPLEENYPFEETGIFEKPGYPALYFVESKYADDPTNWWIPNRACLEAMLRSSGFKIVSNPAEDVYICTLGARNDG